MAEQEEAPYEPLFTPTDNPSQQNVYILTNDVARNSQQPSKVDGSPLVRENSLGKQMSLLHQSSGYLKQATGGLMRWQSRRAFWSAADASGTQPEGVSAACGNTRSSIAFWFKTVWAVSRRHPSVFVAPLLLLCACIGGGIAGVILAANDSQQLAKDDTATMARQAAAALEVTLATMALHPAAAQASLAREQPSAAVLGRELPALMSRLLQQPNKGTTTTSPVRQLVLAPFGTVNATYSPVTTAAGGQAPVGSDMFTAGMSILGTGVVDAVALAVQKQIPVVATVATAATANGIRTINGFPEVLLMVYHPVYVSGVAEGETWGNTISDDYLNKICANGGCYQASSQTKLWGFTLAVVSLSALVSSPEAGLLGLLEGDYRYRVTVFPSGTAAGPVELLTSSPPPKASHAVSPVPVQLAGPRSPTLATSAWTEAELILDHDDAYQTSWEGPLIAVAIVVSLALSAFFFVVVFNYWRHLSMLQSMLPEKVIRVLGTGVNYYQHFDCVTVLYADVVRYTTTKQQGDVVPTLEVVKLLNDVQAMYESIIHKYGLVRISRSGESFICVGGCPTPDDPVAVAVKVAACARDLVLATSRFRGAGGFRVQIRLGLHSGPTVAAVVGSKMPRFSLFGDVVDVAYFMEATSRAMAIHVSDRTSQLLTTANDPRLQLTPRGGLDIVGQGSMNTSWLRLDQIPQPGEPHADDAEEKATERKRVGEGSQAALLTTSPPKP
ncbi:hypothetical protein Vretimale_8963 [Volvox reticuliferus]|uniref:Guanylate cyclase domain-containing protein n=1 Tax=Volvox reticuliferus TaxID=1737510 RepID=A0A8J4CPI4_9CHLO|nr:hypothetical protein Vretifemale_14420 [Volvox reticuliferus]GIM04375.1 hypothetical protein Vretimale_8963 [Volvox reticuliferus]